MKVKVIGRKRPFFGGKLLKIGDVVDVPKELLESKNPPSWAKRVRAESAGA